MCALEKEWCRIIGSGHVLSFCVKEKLKIDCTKY